MKLFDKALNELSIPKNFKNIHSVTDLLEIKKFGNDINTFFEKYLDEWYDSFKMNMDEVLDYIPESELKNYKFAPGYEFIFSNLYLFYVHKDLINKFLSLNLDFKKFENKSDDVYMYYYYGINPYIDNISNILNYINNKDKVYFVDNTKKEIHVCLDNLKLINCHINKQKSKWGLNIYLNTDNYQKEDLYIVNYTLCLHTIQYKSGYPTEFETKINLPHQFNINNNTYTRYNNIFYFHNINENKILQELSNKWLINDKNSFDIAKNYINDYLCKKN